MAASGEPLEPLVGDLANGCGRPELRRGSHEPRRGRPDRNRSLVDQLAPELGDQEGVAAGEVADDAGELLRRLGSGGQADELRELGVREAAEPDPDHAFRPVHVHERLGELGGDVRLGVPERRHDQHARRGARPDEVADEEERRRVGPVEVLEHEQHGRLVRDRDQQLRHGRVESQPLRVRVRRAPARGAGRGEVGDEPREVGPRGAEPVEDGRPHAAAAGELHEGRGERRVRGSDDRVAVAVQDDRALVGELSGELADEPALARARLAGDERRPPSFTDGARQEGPQLRELALAAREPVRGQQPERAWERRRLAHDQF